VAGGVVYVISGLQRVSLDVTVDDSASGTSVWVAMWHRRLSLRLGKQIAALPTCVRLPQALCYHTEADVYGNTARRTYPREESKFLTAV